MSYEELIKAIDIDALRERQKILEDARIETESIIRNTEKELEKLKDDKIAELKDSFERERIRAISNAKREAKALSISAKTEIISKIFKEAEKRIVELKLVPESHRGKDRDYSDILIMLFKEVVEKGVLEIDEFEVYASKDDMHILNSEDVLQGVKIKVNEDMEEGVILISRDNRFRLVNTLKSRLERMKTEIFPLLNRILFEKDKAES